MRWAEDVAVSLAAFGLGGRPRHSLPDGPCNDDQWGRLLGAAQRHRMVGVLEQAISAGAVDVTAAQAEEAERLARQVASACLKLDLLAIAVAEQLDARGVEWRLLKGAANAYLDEIDPLCRQYGDVDVLVHSDDLAAAIEAVQPLGFRRDLPPRRPRFDQRFAKEVSLVGYGAAGIDVHRVLALGPIGAALPVEALWSAHAYIRLAGATIRTLDDAGRFVHACVNALLGDQQPKLAALRDVALLSHGTFADDRVDELAPPGRGAAVVRSAVAAARVTLGEVLGPRGQRAERIPVSRWERWALRTYRSHGGSNTSELLGVAAGLRTWPDRVGYVAALSFPSAEYRLARRRAGRPPEWRTGLREVIERLDVGRKLRRRRAVE